MTDVVTLFNALSDPSRLRIINLLLSAGELCVCDIEAALQFTQTKVSRHMRYLKIRGLVTARRNGRWVYYSIGEPASEHRRAILTALKIILADLGVPAADIRRLPSKIRSGCCIGISTPEAGASGAAQ